MSIDMRHLKLVDPKAFNDIRRDYQKKLKTFPKVLTPVPRKEWPPITSTIVPDETWRSRDYLVQVFRPDGQPVRLSICSTVLANDGSWKDGLTWDELQAVKYAVGFGSAWAVEIYPPELEVVNVANFRHLWIVPKPDFAWEVKP
jgi:hypothetical protein